jgi:hypothetical protein
MIIEINEAVKQIIFHKADLMRNSNDYSKHLDELFKELEIKDIKEAAKLGAIDAMIYDIACSLDFTKRKHKINDWSSYKERKAILKEFWKR